MKIPNNIKLRVEKLSPTTPNNNIKHLFVSNLELTGANKIGYECVKIFTDKTIETKEYKNLEDISLKGLCTNTKMGVSVLTDDDTTKLKCLMEEELSKVLKEDVVINFVCEDETEQHH